jgi:chromosomal replication initiator protein
MADPDRKIWAGVLSHLRTHHAMLCRKWFDELEPAGIAGGVLTVRAQTPLHRDYLTRHCRDQFADAVRAATERLVSVRFVGPETARAAAGLEQEASPGAVAPAPARGALPADMGDDTLAIDPDYGFENFVIGPHNRMAHAAAVAVCDRPGREYNPLFIHGDVGLGKTHLLQAVCLRLLRDRPECAVCYLSCEAFASRCIEAVQAGTMSDLRRRFRQVDVLVIDDVHFLTRREQSQEELFHTFNALHHASRQIVLSSDARPEDIPDLEDRLVSRFKWGLVAEIEAPGFESRVEIVKRKAELRGLSVPDGVAAAVASHGERNIRELEGALARVQALAATERRPIDIEIARRALGNPPLRSPAPNISFQAILDGVTGYWGVRLADLQSKRRHRSITLPRQVCMYLARTNTRLSLEEIGRYFGGRDHTTVMYAVDKVQELRRTRPDIEAAICTIEVSIRGLAAARAD